MVGTRLTGVEGGGGWGGVREEGKAYALLIKNAIHSVFQHLDNIIMCTVLTKEAFTRL